MNDNVEPQSIWVNHSLCFRVFAVELLYTNEIENTMQVTTLIFATNNQHKVDEIKHIIGNQYHIFSLAEADIVVDIPEPYDTLEENAAGKSKVIHELTGQNCFSEDTGLEVDALQGEPGVKSARYAGEDKNFSANIDKLLLNLQGETNRKARFRTVISLILEDEKYLFEGICSGTITELPKGEGGFGYDAVFLPEDSNKTFAQMTMDEKNVYSHRRKATDKLIQFLQNHNG